MGGKNKELVAQKRRQVAAAREAERRRKAAIKKEKLKGGTSTSSVRQEALKLTDDQFPDDTHLFWLCHGVNYIVSNHEQAIWNPLFPEIYEGKLPIPEAVAERVVNKYSEFAEWPIEGKAALGWTVQSKEVVYVYYKEAHRRLMSRYPDGDAEELCRQPHDLVLWGLFNFLKERLLPTKVRKASRKRIGGRR